MFKIITEAEVEALVDFSDAIATTRAAHLALRDKTARNVVRNRARSGKMSLHLLSAIDCKNGFAACKVYTAVPRMAASHLLLYRVDDGELVAMIEAATLGQMRTAAAAYLGATCSVSQKEITLGVVGSGYQAEGVCHAFLSTGSKYTIKKLLLAGRSPDKVSRLVEKLKATYKREIQPATLEELCHSAEVIVTATTSQTAVLPETLPLTVKHISALGANSLIRQELPAKLIASANKLIVDSIEVAKAEGGNLLPLVETGKLAWEELQELKDAIEAPEQPKPGLSIFCSHGMGVQDLFLGALIFKRLTT